MVITTFHKYHYSAILVSKPAERWQRVHTEMARPVTGRHSGHWAQSRTPDTGAGSGMHWRSSHMRQEQRDLPSVSGTGRVGDQVQGAWDKLYQEVRWLPLCLAQVDQASGWSERHCEAAEVDWASSCSSLCRCFSLRKNASHFHKLPCADFLAILSQEVSSPHYSSTWQPVRFLHTIRNFIMNYLVGCLLRFSLTY